MSRWELYKLHTSSSQLSNLQTDRHTQPMVISHTLYICIPYRQSANYIVTYCITIVTSLHAPAAHSQTVWWSIWNEPRSCCHDSQLTGEHLTCIVPRAAAVGCTYSHRPPCGCRVGIGHLTVALSTPHTLLSIDNRTIDILIFNYILTFLNSSMVPWHMGHFDRPTAHAEHVLTWPQGRTSISRVMVLHTQHSVMLGELPGTASLVPPAKVQ